MAAEKQVQATRAKYFHVRIDSLIDSVRDVHCLFTSVLQTTAPCAGDAYETVVRKILQVSTGFEHLCLSTATKANNFDEFITFQVFKGFLINVPTFYVKDTYKEEISFMNIK